MIDLPPMRPIEWPAVLVHREELAGAEAWTVTVSDGIGQPVRHWFGRHSDALAFAAGQADRSNLALFDVADPQ